ncbi:MAG: hypothetical protein KOO61_00805 [Spirochaetales bacterium]|nr:hypothetical protein [Spirochaetales bacterium]
MRKAFLLITLITILLVPAFAQDDDGNGELFVPVYSLGDQTLRINLGTFFPLFFFGGPDGPAPANLTLGGAGSLVWESYLSSTITIGVEVGGSFSFTPNFRTLFMLPIAVRGSYIFNLYPFEIPVTLAAGMNFSRLSDIQKIDPFVKAGGSFLWNYSSQWAFGGNLFYWFVPQIYLATSPAGADATRYGNFLEFTLSALYHF